MGVQFSISLREEHRSRVFEKRVLTKIFRPKKKERTELKELHNKEPHNFTFCPVF
jgi:hypothetical protein